MPVVFVYGMPNDATVIQKLHGLTHNIRRLVSSFPEFRLTFKEVSVFFPHDLLQEGLGKELIVKVEGLLKKPERSWPLRQSLATKLQLLVNEFAEKHLVRCNLVEVFVDEFDPETNTFA